MLITLDLQLNPILFSFPHFFPLSLPRPPFPAAISRVSATSPTDGGVICDDRLISDGGRFSFGKPSALGSPSLGVAGLPAGAGLPARVLHRAETSIPIRKLSQGKPLNHFLLFNTLLADLGPAFIVERIELLDLGVDQSFNVPTISSGWLAGSGWGESLDLEELSGLVPWIGLGNLNICVKLSSGLPYHLQYLSTKQVIFSKHALVNMLVTYLSHFLDGTDEYLKSILYSTILCHSSSRNNCKGRVNIKYYIVPGYKKTGAAKSNKDRCADDKLKKMALRVIAESLSEEEIAGLKEAIPCDGHQQRPSVHLSWPPLAFLLLSLRPWPPSGHRRPSSSLLRGADAISSPPRFNRPQICLFFFRSFLDFISLINQ
ncbi:hypothetical protein ZIOFF_043848 [Zingiber officinale]|uniref:Uncharacterized protein n=1 Tax=Zingiber officinale TaxID=94328 RepID=A0A8J5KZ83_ZINOF|nr:hypothetical protein ZIOFF_043848 [Zingiber officinale]